MNNIYDPERKYSKEELCCKSCIPKIRIGGAAMTWSTCKICGKKILNESTAVNVVCEKCSIESRYCVICGNKIEE